MTPEQQAHIEEHIDEQVKTCFHEAKPKWYHLNLAQTVTVLTVLIGGLYALVQYQARLNNAELWMQAMTVRVNSMDSMGTQFSQRTIGLDHQILMAHEQRLIKLEDVSIRLAVIESQLSQLSKDFSSYRNEHRP